MLLESVRPINILLDYEARPAGKLLGFTLIRHRFHELL